MGSGEVAKPLHSSVLSSWHANIFIMIKGPAEARKDGAFRCSRAGKGRLDSRHARQAATLML